MVWLSDCSGGQEGRSASAHDVVVAVVHLEAQNVDRRRVHPAAVVAPGVDLRIPGAPLATFAAALVPAVAIGFNWKRATATAVNVAIIVSLSLNFGIEILGITIPYGINGGALALLVSLTLFFGISLASPPPKIDADIEAVMDL